MIHFDEVTMDEPAIKFKINIHLMNFPFSSTTISTRLFFVLVNIVFTTLHILFLDS